MNTNRLVISSKKYKGDTSVFSVRLPLEMVKELDNISELTGRNRNEIISLCLEFAIENMVVNDSTEKNVQNKGVNDGRY